MIIEVDTANPTPPYEQIRAQITQLAETGVLPVGSRLPTIRQLASDLGIAPGTVARAYRELESTSVVLSRVRHGTTIAAKVKPSQTQLRERATEAARTYAVTARSLGLSKDEAIEALLVQMAELGPSAGVG